LRNFLSRVKVALFDRCFIKIVLNISKVLFTRAACRMHAFHTYSVEKETVKNLVLFSGHSIKRPHQTKACIWAIQRKKCVKYF